ncbi:hypothetical protein ACIG87_27930 [Micromonospora sp. NPDC051925]|uniref:hypothetical protein n=1 Tax=Micromonospora sp. NPDC051925 TaxID=3364288 RepID=UPI0037CB378D
MNDGPPSRTDLFLAARQSAEQHRDGKRCGSCTGHGGCRQWRWAEEHLAARVTQEHGADVLARWREVRRRHGYWHGPGKPCPFCRGSSLGNGCWLDDYAREQLAAVEHAADGGRA